MKTLILMLFSICYLYGSTTEPLASIQNSSFLIAEETSPVFSKITQTAETFGTLPPLGRKQKNEWIAVGLSFLMPGLGHVYLDDIKTASGLMTTASLEAAAAFSPSVHDKSLRNFSFHAFTATAAYGIYAAYRDTRVHNGLSQYRYQMPMDDFADLSFAPFKWSVIKQPEVWGGVLGTFLAATALVYFAYPHDASLTIQKASTSQWPAVAFPVGLGEETYFRGFWQSYLSETYNPLTGTVLSSLLFGAAHVGNAQALPASEQWRYYAFSIPLITAIGAYCGWMTHNTHSLQQSVAFHAWYDFILFSIEMLASEKAAISIPMQFALAIPF